MKKIPALLVLAVILFGGLAAYLYLHRPEPRPPAVKALPHPPSPLPPQVHKEPEANVVLEAPSEHVALPPLAQSDSYMLESLAGLLGDKSLLRLFVPGTLIHNIVATVDNLPRRDSTMNVMPVKPVPGRFKVSGKGDELIISPKNARRYAPYVKLAEATNAEKLVEIYIRLYPLFQQAYEELGYPKKYFNDRLMVALDDLLAAPDIRAPVGLIRPKVFYLFADQDLEDRSIGQRILMRTGSKNEAIIRAKLQEIRQELMRHMHEQKVEASPE